MMQLFIAPMDVWLFRDGKPFDAESDHRATSLFPPYPSVMQGVIRSQHLVENKVNLNDRAQIEEWVGTTDKYGDLRLRGPFIAKWENEQLTRYFPVPADMAAQGDKFVPLEMREPDASELLTNAPTEKLLYSRVEPTKKSPGQWLTQETLREALKGEAVCAVQSHKLFERESRFGIGREDNTRTTREGALYEAEFIRPCKNVGLYVEVSGYEGWQNNGVMRIGGEGRGATYEIITKPELALPKLEGALPAKFKVYFATPTYFKNGWLPASWGKFFDGDVRLVAAAVNRYESIGGFDWANQSHKPAQRYVPAGSVYYLESDGTAKLQDHVLEMNAIADEGAQIGFGQIFIQEVNHV